jgi:protein-tyrosine phosphatase
MSGAQPQAHADQQVSFSHHSRSLTCVEQYYSLLKWMNRSERLIAEYGLEDDFDSQINEQGINLSSQKKSDSLRIALSNMFLALKDGLPIQIPGFSHLYLGSIGSAYNLHSLCTHSITHILCLSSVIKQKYPDRFTYLRLAVADKAYANILETFEDAFAFIESAKHAKVLVHCYQGISRSVTICCGYMMKYYGYSAESALKTIRLARPTALPNSGFLAALKIYQQILNRTTVDKSDATPPHSP